MFNLLKKLKQNKTQYYNNPYHLDGYSFIWGVKADDDLTKFPSANFDTMNDIEITYHSKISKYELSIEEIYGFDSFFDKIQYLNRLLRYFGLYLDSCNISIPDYKEIDIDIIKEDFDIRLEQNKPLFDCESDSIVNLYIMFRAKLDYFHSNEDKIKLKCFGKEK